MKKKLDTRFPAARIKRIMQSDDDVGKIAMAVPLLISKALEHFLQDLCDRTCEITLKRGAKTMSSSHLKLCVQSFSVFDFLKEIFHRVPDLDVSSVAIHDQPIAKRRKLANVDNDKFGETENKMHGTGNPKGGGKRQMRGRGRGRGRRPEADMFEDDPDMHDEMHDLHSSAHDATMVLESKCEASLLDEDKKPVIRGFDLNVDLDENGNAPSLSVAYEPSTTTSTEPDPKMKLEEHHEWPLYEMGWGNVVLDPFQLVSMNQPKEEDEDYDREG